jgi:CheY-like chemotaxis protein
LVRLGPGMKQILVVDDSKSMRLALRLLLQSRSELEVCGEAVDGLDAIEKAKRLKPDVILLDLAMPKLNGALAALVLRSDNPAVKIILFTLYADSVRDKMAAVSGIDLVVSKADGLGHLLQCIYELGGQTNAH